MQTFLPVKSFVKSAEFLDDKRLGKQRIEAAQILEILLKISILPSRLQSAVPFDPTFHRWHHHPAVLMWSGHEEWLKNYLDCVIGEWRSRGFANSITVPRYDCENQPYPIWLGMEEFHRSHRTNLIRKNPSYYLKFWPEERDDSCLYYWPTKISETQRVNEGEEVENAHQNDVNS